MPVARPCLVDGALHPSARAAARAMRADGHKSASEAGISSAIARGGGEGVYLGVPVRWGPPTVTRLERAREVNDRLRWRGMPEAERATLLAATPEERAAMEADWRRPVLAIGAAILRRRGREWATAEESSVVRGPDLVGGHSNVRETK